MNSLEACLQFIVLRLTCLFIRRHSSVGIATGYELDGPEIESCGRGETYRNRPDLSWGPLDTVKIVHILPFFSKKATKTLLLFDNRNLDVLNVFLITL